MLFKINILSKNDFLFKYQQCERKVFKGTLKVCFLNEWNLKDEMSFEEIFFDQPFFTKYHIIHSIASIGDSTYVNQLQPVYWLNPIHMSLATD